jgi:hypothetical protein
MTFRLPIRQNELRVNPLFLAHKRLSARAVYNELTTVLGANTIASSTVTKYLRQRQFSSMLAGPPRGTSDDRY